MERGELIMKKSRRRALTYGNAELTDAEIADGYHFCDEWDGLVVGPGHPAWGWAANFGRPEGRCVCGYRPNSQEPPSPTC